MVCFSQRIRRENVQQIRKVKQKKLEVLYLKSNFSTGKCLSSTSCNFDNKMISEIKPNKTATPIRKYESIKSKNIK
mgnify:CR=1 FL=1